MDMRIMYGVSGGVLLYLFGNFTEAMYLLATVMMLDFATGTLKGIYQKKLNSSVSRNGVIRKIGMIMGVAIMFMIDKHVGTGVLFRDLAVNMFIVTELISNLENLAEIGVIMPTFVKNFLEKYEIIKK